ncbi:MAG: DUF3080 family protein [Halioglobus sp.]
MLTLLLPGCQPGAPEDPLQAYVETLSATLSVASEATPAPSTIPPPTSGGLPSHPASIPLEGIGLLALTGCAVQATIGKYDSSLGRSAKASQRLILALEYLRLAPACIRQLQKYGNAALARRLQTGWHKQRAHLPELIFNATLGSEEYRAFWLASPAPGDFPRSGHEATANALRSIDRDVRRWLGGDYRAQNRSFELLLSEIAGGDGGALWQALSRHSQWLHDADTILEQYRHSQGRCMDYQRFAAITRLSIRFNGEIQSRYTQSISRYREYLAAISALEHQLSDALTPHYLQWLAARNQHLNEIDNAADQHSAQLEHLRLACAP